MQELLRNPYLQVVVVSWGLAQMLKPVLYWITRRKWDWHWLYSSGGMPSAHTASFSALATAVGLIDGLQTATFAIAMVTAIVVSYDAAGVRRAAGAQARILNQILEELFSGRPIAEEHLREFIGHTPFEVIVGAALGVGTAWLMLR